MAGRGSGAGRGEDDDVEQLLDALHQGTIHTRGTAWLADAERRFPHLAGHIRPYDECDPVHACDPKHCKGHCVILRSDMQPTSAPRLAGVQDIVLCLRSGVYHSHGPSPCPFEVVPPGARSSNSGVTMCALTDVVLCMGTDDAGPEMEHDDDGNVVTGAHTGGYAQRMYAAPEDAARTALGAESTGKVSAAMRRQTRETASRASKRVQVAAPRAAETPYALATSVLNSAGAYAGELADRWCAEVVTSAHDTPVPTSIQDRLRHDDGTEFYENVQRTCMACIGATPEADACARLAWRLYVAAEGLATATRTSRILPARMSPEKTQRLVFGMLMDLVHAQRAYTEVAHDGPCVPPLCPIFAATPTTELPALQQRIARMLNHVSGRPRVARKVLDAYRTIMRQYSALLGTAHMRALFSVVRPIDDGK